MTLPHTGTKAIVAEQIFLDSTDIVESTVVRTQDEFLKIYQCCKITLTINGKTVEKPVMAWWLDQKDRKIRRDIDFLTTDKVRCRDTLSLTLSKPNPEPV